MLLPARNLQVQFTSSFPAAPLSSIRVSLRLSRVVAKKKKIFIVAWQNVTNNSAYIYILSNDHTIIVERYLSDSLLVDSQSMRKRDDVSLRISVGYCILCNLIFFRLRDSDRLNSPQVHRGFSEVFIQIPGNFLRALQQ